MQWKRPALVVTLGLFAAITISGCGRGTLATVNGEKITKDEFDRRIERSSIQELVQASGGQNVQVGTLVLQRMIDERLWDQIAKEKNVAPTDKQIQDRIAQLQKQGLRPSALKAAGMTMEDLKEIVRRDLDFYNAVTKGVTVPPADVRAYYDQYKDQRYTQPERVHVAGIVCGDKANIDKAFSKVNSGSDFGTVALSMSVDDFSRPRKGEMGWVFRNMKNVPPSVITQAFSLSNDNAISNPFYVGASKQWVIIKRLGRQPMRVTSFDEVKDQILQGMKLVKAQPRVKEMLETKRKNSKIVIKSDRYKAMAPPPNTKTTGKKG